MSVRIPGFSPKMRRNKGAPFVFLLKIGKKETVPVLFALIPQRQLRILSGVVDQIRLFGTIICSGPPKILI